MCRDLVLVRSATVPLAKFSIDGVKIDLIFADMASPVNYQLDLNR